MTDPTLALPIDGPLDESGTRRDFIHVIAATATLGGVAAVAWPLIEQLGPSADTMALASIEVDYSKVAVGQQLVVLWRKQPVYIRHRTAAEIASAVRGDQEAVIDPAKDADRHKAGKAEWLVVIGVCTHLGCAPTFGEGDFQGWFCHCHGSMYDTSGRVRRGPAPKNLAIPDYAFLSDTRMKLG